MGCFTDGRAAARERAGLGSVAGAWEVLERAESTSWLVGARRTARAERAYTLFGCLGRGEGRAGERRREVDVWQRDGELAGLSDLAQGERFK